jgi:hypothetical protein
MLQCYVMLHLLVVLVLVVVVVVVVVVIEVVIVGCSCAFWLLFVVDASLSYVLFCTPSNYTCCINNML